MKASLGLEDKSFLKLSIFDGNEPTSRFPRKIIFRGFEFTPFKRITTFLLFSSSLPNKRWNIYPMIEFYQIVTCDAACQNNLILDFIILSSLAVLPCLPRNIKPRNVIRLLFFPPSFFLVASNIIELFTLFRLTHGTLSNQRFFFPLSKWKKPLGWNQWLQILLCSSGVIKKKLHRRRQKKP